MIAWTAVSLCAWGAAALAVVLVYDTPEGRPSPRGLWWRAALFGGVAAAAFVGALRLWVYA